jgi:acetoin utilization deacetylase AcuC-like enzyme
VRVVYSDNHKLHDPEHDIQGGVAFPMAEQPERIERILQSLRNDTTFEVQAPTAHGQAPIESVHAAGLIAFLEHAWATDARGEEMFPDTFLHPGIREGMEPLIREPTEAIGRLGRWCFDTGTPIVGGTLAAARAAVDVALTAADLVLAGEASAYGACRPPGHHAAHAVYGGFCYFNNAAIAADYLVKQSGGKVAVLDLDYHHGNGTQQIFYRRDDVLYVSLHGDPRRAYPYFSGHVEETGAGPGLGATLNVPLQANTSDAHYLDALEPALEALRRFQATVTVLSLGIDTYVDDPLGDFALTTEVYADMGKRVAEVARPLVVLQEGGYHLPRLGENVRQFLGGVQAAQRIK